MVDCVFCHIRANTTNYIAQNSDFFCVFDIHPVSDGHALLIAKRHTPSFFDLSKDELQSLFDIAKKTKSILDQKFHPDAYNLGINDGSAAGQLIPHFHVHLIPRKTGDYKGSIEQWKKGSPSRGTSAR